MVVTNGSTIHKNLTCYTSYKAKDERNKFSNYQEQLHKSKVLILNFFTTQKESWNGECILLYIDCLFIITSEF